jgi:hypothetical protein
MLRAGGEYSCLSLPRKKGRMMPVARHFGSVLGVAVLVLLGTSIVLADRYSVTVKRLDKDLYQDATSKTIIETRYCYEYAYGEEAVLTWEGRYGNNSLIFKSSGTKCEVVSLR